MEGSVDQALKGKHYRRGLRCIMLWQETLIHKRLNIVLEKESLSTENSHNLDILKKELVENKDNLASVYADLETDQNIQKLVDAVYERANTDMGEYWMSFMEMSDILLQDVNACHVGNLDEYLLSACAMLPGMLVYNNHDYGKWLPDYWLMISSFHMRRKCILVNILLNH